jgi:hypothetical protein
MTAGVRMLLTATVLACAACENGSPPPGAGCQSVGGECVEGVCGESLPDPCPGTQTCCVPSAPSPPKDAGAG